MFSFQGYSFHSSSDLNVTRESQAKTFQVPETGACIMEIKEIGDRRIQPKLHSLMASLAVILGMVPIPTEIAL